MSHRGQGFQSWDSWIWNVPRGPVWQRLGAQFDMLGDSGTFKRRDPVRGLQSLGVPWKGTVGPCLFRFLSLVLWLPGEQLGSKTHFCHHSPKTTGHRQKPSDLGAKINLSELMTSSFLLQSLKADQHKKQGAEHMSDKVPCGPEMER
jgi:hypothetical protein